MVRLKRKYTSLLKWVFYALYLSLAIYVFQILLRDNIIREEQKFNFLQNRTFRNLPQKVDFTFVTHRNEFTAVTRRNTVLMQKENNSLKNGFIKMGTKAPHYQQYPLNVDLKDIVRRRMMKEPVTVNVINPHPFHYTLNPKKKCLISETFLLILVKSAANHTKNREAIRKTWGKIPDSGTKLVFLVGSSNIDSAIVAENADHHDIVQENFLDVYWNNTYKTIMGFNWATTFCPKAHHILFVDDDYFVNLQNLLYFVRHLNHNMPLFTGTLLPWSVPYRENSSKWYVSMKDYPFQRYPPYLAGGAIIVSMDVAQKMAAAFPYVKYLVIDDAYLGIVAYKLGIGITRNSWISDKHCQDWSMRIKIACHGFSNVTNLLETYKRLKKPITKPVSVKNQSQPQLKRQGMI